MKKNDIKFIVIIVILLIVMGAMYISFTSKIKKMEEMFKNAQDGKQEIEAEFKKAGVSPNTKPIFKVIPLGDNVFIEVGYKTKEHDDLSYNFVGSGYTIGEFEVFHSLAMKITCDKVVQFFSQDLQDLLENSEQFDIVVTGGADALPCQKPYQGGQNLQDIQKPKFYSKDKNIYMDNWEKQGIFVNKTILDNDALAYLRAKDVEQYLIRHISSFQDFEKSTFEIETDVSKIKGNQYRYVTVNIMLHGALKTNMNDAFNEVFGN